MQKKVFIYIIKPSKYDADGYVIRYFRGVLPSNTIACLNTIIQNAFNTDNFLQSFDVHINLFDELVHRIPYNQIKKNSKKYKVLCLLAGIQSNQFERAKDLAYKLIKYKCKVLMGGFHISGFFIKDNYLPDSFIKLMESGITLVAGEADEKINELLKDALTDKLKTNYNYLSSPPNLKGKPVPFLPRSYMKKFAYPRMGTVDTSRGCPYNCSFCTIINIQGRKMRARYSQEVLEAIEHNYDNSDVNYYFFTDDNFCRNPDWLKIINGLIKLKKKGKKIEFMLQVDTLSHKLEQFIDKVREAGCTQVFVGMESINSDNLKSVGKTQNSISEYKNLIAAWHRTGIAVHVGYIIGFPFDTPQSILEDIERLKNEFLVDQISFFILTHLPGSRDFIANFTLEQINEMDFNLFDSFHETFKHLNFEKGKLYNIYQKCWESFYSLDNMKSILSRANKINYWGLLKNFIWFKSSILMNEHPMVAGFFRLKDRKDRRPGYPTESIKSYYLNRLKEFKTLLKQWIKIFFIFQEVWLETRIQSQIEMTFFEQWENAKVQLQKNINNFYKISDNNPTFIKLQKKYRRIITKTRKTIEYWHSFISSFKKFKLPGFKNFLKLPYYTLKEIYYLILFLLNLFVSKNK